VLLPPLKRSGFLHLKIIMKRKNDKLKDFIYVEPENYFPPEAVERFVKLEKEREANKTKEEKESTDESIHKKKNDH